MRGAENNGLSGQKLSVSALLRTAPESDDIDQGASAKNIPAMQQLAFAFTPWMDGCSETRNAESQITVQTHAMYCPVLGCFPTGGPAYELFEALYWTQARLRLSVQRRLRSSRPINRDQIPHHKRALRN